MRSIRLLVPKARLRFLYKDASKALHAAEAMKITADHILSLSVIDGIIPEPKGGAHRDLAAQAEYIKSAIWEQLQHLLSMNEQELLEDRYRKFREIGRFTFTQEGKPCVKRKLSVPLDLQANHKRI